MPKALSTAQTPPSAAPADEAPHGSAQQIWLAGLGALAQAQAQGTKAFEALVSDGLQLQQKTQAEARQRLQEATERLTHLAQDFGQQASGRVDRLEHMFEDRVARALQRLGMPTLADLQALQSRIEALEAAMKPTAKAGTRADNQTKSQSKRQAKSPAKNETNNETNITAASARSATGSAVRSPGVTNKTLRKTTAPRP